MKKPKISTTAITVISWGTTSLSLKFTAWIIYEFIKKGLEKSSPFYVIYNLNYLDGGTYNIPPLVHNSFGPLSGKIPVSAIFLL